MYVCKKTGSLLAHCVDDTRKGESRNDLKKLAKLMQWLKIGVVEDIGESTSLAKRTDVRTQREFLIVPDGKVVKDVL